MRSTLRRLSRAVSVAGSEVERSEGTREGARFADAATVLSAVALAFATRDSMLSDLAATAGKYLRKHEGLWVDGDGAPLEITRENLARVAASGGARVAERPSLVAELRESIVSWFTAKPSPKAKPRAPLLEPRKHARYFLVQLADRPSEIREYLRAHGTWTERWGPRGLTSDAAQTLVERAFEKVARDFDVRRPGAMAEKCIIEAVKALGYPKNKADSLFG